MQRDPLFKIILDLEKWVSERDYRGYDPYDGLRSKILRILPLPGKYARIAWIQFFKHCPVNLRPRFLIPKGRNPKGMGLFLSSYVCLYHATHDRVWLEKAIAIAEWLENHTCTGYSGKCWGYNFDWQSRAFFIPAGTPTIVNTSFIGQAFLDLFDATGDRRWLRVAESACQFVINDLNRYERRDHICFSYTPIDESKVHNANLLGSGLLARTSKLLNSTDWQDIICRSAKYSLDHQRHDGAWYYAQTDYQNWIDSFHTGFNLMSLRWIHEFAPSFLTSNAISKGQRFYAENFFLSDGTPKYYHNRTYPIDIHSPAMALRYLSGIENYEPLADCTADWMIAHMRQADGSFIFQKKQVSIGRHRVVYSIRIPYMRWGQAWALYGLSWYLHRHNSFQPAKESPHFASRQYETALD